MIVDSQAEKIKKSPSTDLGGGLRNSLFLLPLSKRGSLSRGSSLSLLWLSPLGSANPLVLFPRTEVSKLTATLTLASTAKLNGQVLSGDLGQKLLLVSAVEDVDLANGDRVKEALEGAEHAAEAPRGVDQVQLTEALGVVVLGNIGGLLDVSVDGGHAGDPNALQVHDCAAGLEKLASLAGAGEETWVAQLLGLGHEVLEHAFACCDLVHLVQVDLAQFLNVHGASILL